MDLLLEIRKYRADMWNKAKAFLAEHLDENGNVSDENLSIYAEMENKVYTASSGGGMVTAGVNGKHQVQSLEINPEAVDPDDVEMLQDMVIAAINEAMRAADEDSANNMSRLTGGLNLGGLF